MEFLVFLSRDCLSILYHIFHIMSCNQNKNNNRSLWYPGSSTNYFIKHKLFIHFILLLLFISSIQCPWAPTLAHKLGYHISIASTPRTPSNISLKNSCQFHSSPWTWQGACFRAARALSSAVQEAFPQLLVSNSVPRTHLGYIIFKITKTVAKFRPLLTCQQQPCWKRQHKWVPPLAIVLTLPWCKRALPVAWQVLMISFLL